MPTSCNPIDSSFVLFSAKSHEALKERSWTTADKTRQIAWNTLSVVIPVIGLARLLGWYALAPIGRLLTLPAAKFIPESEKARTNADFRNFWTGPANGNRLRENFECSEHKVSTPDGATIHTTVFSHKESHADTPTILYFQPNMALSKHMAIKTLMRQSVLNNMPCHFVMFDYRGVGESQGHFQKTQELMIDGESVYQFIRDQLKVPPSQIRFYGWSLGAGVAANVKALHPECDGKSVLERTFSATSHVVPAKDYILTVLLCWLPPAMRRLNLELDCASAATKMSGKKLIVYHPKDPEIPRRAGLFNALKNTLKPDEVLELPFMDPIWNDHCQDLERYRLIRDGKEIGADEIIANFILGK